jgi:small conductance mechanosensitive channel
MQKIEASVERIIQAILQRVPSIILGILILILGIYVIRLILRIVRNRFVKADVDMSLRDFIISILKFVLYPMLIISSASTMGIQTTSFLAVLSAASLAIGLSLQGSLSNFAGGVLILLFKPFRIGDNINSGTGASGNVERIDILYTTLRTSEGFMVFAPNGPLANTVITNYTNIHSRKIEYKLDLASATDIKKARTVIMEVLKEDSRILATPAPAVLVNQITGNATSILINFWTLKDDYAIAFHDNQERIKEALDERGVAVFTG